MKKSKIKKIAFLMAVIMLLTALPFTFSASAIEEGVCGSDNSINWTLDKETGTLKISGSGVLTDTEEAWADLYPYINHAIVNDGITEIGDGAFYDCRSLMTVEIPDNITRIGESAFAECLSLQAIDIPDTVTEIGDCAFADCLSLETVNLDTQLESVGFGAFGNCQSLTDIYVYLSDTVFDNYSLGYLDEYVDTDKITVAEFVEKLRQAFVAQAEGDGRTASEIFSELGECKSTIEKIADTLIHCYKGSTAEAYAVENNMNYTYFENHEHSYKLVSDSATCAQKGEKTYKCPCGDTYSEQSVQLPHTEVAYEDAESTCSQAGHKGGTYCEVCKTEITAPEALPLKSHSFGDWVNDFDALIRTRTCGACSEKETEILEATTENGEVEIVAPATPDAEFTVDEIGEVDEAYVIIEETLSKDEEKTYEVIKAFDINLKNKDGVHIQPDGSVKVKLPLDWTKEGNYKVYRVNDDGTLTDMNAYRQGSHMVFETDHFSIYVIVEENEKVEEPVTPDEPPKKSEKGFFEKILDWLNSLFDLIASWFKK